MVANTVDTKVESTSVAGAAAQTGGAPRRWMGTVGVVVLLIALALGGGATLRQRASHPAVPASTHKASNAQMRFLENNTTNLPNAVSTDNRPIASSTQQRFIDVNTAWLPAAANATPEVMTTSQRRFLEVNTTMMPMATSLQTARECTHPTVGFPTCYALQDDGTWAREELVDVDSGWVVVGTVTYDEMKAAVEESITSGAKVPSP